MSPSQRGLEVSTDMNWKICTFYRKEIARNLYEHHTNPITKKVPVTILWGVTQRQNNES